MLRFWMVTPTSCSQRLEVGCGRLPSRMTKSQDWENGRKAFQLSDREDTEGAVVSKSTPGGCQSLAVFGNTH